LFCVVTNSLFLLWPLCYQIKFSVIVFFVSRYSFGLSKSMVTFYYFLFPVGFQAQPLFS
jgi:hypothetical protein